MGIGFGIRGSRFKGPNFSINIRSYQKLFRACVLLSGFQDDRFRKEGFRLYRQLRATQPILLELYNPYLGLYSPFIEGYTARLFRSIGYTAHLL